MPSCLLCDAWSNYAVVHSPVVLPSDTVSTVQRARLRDGTSTYSCSSVVAHGSCIGDERMSTVSRDRIIEIVSALDEKIVAGELSWKTAATTWGVVKTMFRDARASKNRALQVRSDDPTDGVEPPERGEETSKAFLYPTSSSSS